jgi:hypothetical protein
MKEISKKDLLAQLREQSEMGELAYVPKGTQDISNKLAKFRAIYKPGNETKTPDAWELKKLTTYTDPETNKKKKELVPGSERIWVPLDGAELEAFVEANQEWLDSLSDKYGMSPELVAAKRTTDTPRSAKAGTSYQHSGITKPASTKIKIELNRLVEEYLENPKVSARLERLSIPEIKARDRAHINRNGRVDNQEVNYQTHTFNSYTSAKQFLAFVTARVTGNLARQFSQIYQNWEETKKNQLSYAGKTDRYGLEKFGFDEDNLDVTVRMDLSITGKMLDNQYLWTINFKTKFGRKLREERWLRNGLELDKDKTIRKTVQLEPGVQFDDKNTIMDSLPIKTGLIEALDELRDLIMTKFKPVEMLDKANVKQYDITKRTQTNEGAEIAKIVIGKIKNLKG